MVELASPVLECFADLSDEEREILFETFQAWQDHDGSVRTVGEMLFCHPIPSAIGCTASSSALAVP